MLILIYTNERTHSNFFYSHTTAGKVKVIIKKARRAKTEVGKRSKSKQLDKIERENGKPGKRNLKKIPLRALIRRINHCCQSNFRIILIVVLVHGKKLCQR